MDLIDTRTVKGAEYRVTIETDSDATDPRTEWGCDDVETIQQWRDGEVYGYVIERRYDACSAWEHVDSLWELYGYDYAVNQARDALKHV